MNSKLIVSLGFSLFTLALLNSTPKAQAQSGDFTTRMNQELDEIAKNEGFRSRRYVEGKVKKAVAALLTTNSIKTIEEALAVISTHQAGVSFDDILFHLQGHSLETSTPSKIERLLWLGAQIANTFTGEITPEEMQKLGEIYIEIIQNPKANYGLRIQAALQLNILAVRRGHRDLRVFSRIIDSLAREAQIQKQTFLADVLKAFPYITANELEVELLRIKLATSPDAENIKGIRKVVWVMARLERSGFRSGRLAIANSPIVKAIRDGSLGLKEYADLYMHRFTERVKQSRSNHVPEVVVPVSQPDQEKHFNANSNPLSQQPLEVLKVMNFEDLLVQRDITTEDIQKIQRKVIDYAHERELNLRDGFGAAKDFHIQKFRENIRTFEEYRNLREQGESRISEKAQESRFARAENETAAERAQERTKEAQTTGESRTERKDERRVGRFRLH